MKPLAIIWSPEARANLRSIDKETAMQILYCVTRHQSARAGDVGKLKPPFTGLRLRCGDYRVFFDMPDADSMEITGVKHRREAYR